MTRFDRLNLSSRAFSLAAILGLSLALFDTQAVRATILLAAISATAMAADVSSRLSRAWVCLAESLLASLIIAVSLPGALPLLPYLVVPSLIVGISVGLRAVFGVVALELVVLTALPLVLTSETAASQLATIVLPWIITALGVGALSAWLRELRLGVRGLPGDSHYESARRLLTQLRSVARRLSSGLDALTISSQLLVTVQQHLDDTHAAVFVITENGLLAPLGYRGPESQHDLLPDEDILARLHDMGRALQVHQASGQANRRNRVVMPLRSEDRIIGIVVAESADGHSQRVLDLLELELEQFSLKLDTALAFDEIRALATMEERQRLAREIHDGIAQEISALGYVVDDLTATATSDQQKRKLDALRSELSRVVSELRLSIFDLKSEVSGGLGSALSAHVRQVGSRSGMTVHLTLDEAPTRLRPEVEAELLRIAQEAVTNARKHSGAANLWVDCRISPPYARLEIADDGRGLGRARDDSYGIGIMRERAARINADLLISDSASADRGHGTTVVVTVGTEAPTAARSPGRGVKV